MSGFRAWLQRERSSTRLAFLLQTMARVANAVLAILWTRLLLQAMGVELNGLWLSFQALATLGGLGDLGMGSAVAIRMNRLLGQRADATVDLFLSSARALFLCLAVLAGGIYFLLSPWLAMWLDWPPLAAAGSLHTLVLCAAAGVVPIILSSYIANVNYGCGNVMWPIVPSFLLSQAALAGHWLLARQHEPLWIQYLPYIGASALSLGMSWWFVRASHPSFASILALRVNWQEWRLLGSQSFWLYFWSLGSVVYTNVARLLIPAGFGAATLPYYYNNYKVCELMLLAIASASFAALPKVTSWLASDRSTEQARGVTEVLRLNRVQVFLSCACALAYLAGNNLFIRLWFAGIGDFRVPLSWQFAFALSMAITGAGDAAIQLSPRCGERGLRVAGLAVGATALINLGLSLLAVKARWILGFALAAVVAQSFFSLWISRFVCGELKLSWGKWIARSWLLPVLVTNVAYVARSLLAWDRWWQALLLAGIYAVLLWGVAAAAGLSLRFVQEELKIVRGIFRSRG